MNTWKTSPPQLCPASWGGTCTPRPSPQVPISHIRLRHYGASPGPQRAPATEPHALTWTEVQVVMTLVPRLVLSLRSSGKEGVFSARGACVAWNEGFLGERFPSVPLPKAWMAFPVGEEGAGRCGEIKATSATYAPHHPSHHHPCDSPELGTVRSLSRPNCAEVPLPMQGRTGREENSKREAETDRRPNRQTRG